MSSFGFGMYGGGRGMADNNANAEEISADVRDWYLLSRLLKLLSPYWIAVAFSLGCSLASTLLQVINPLVLSIAIDTYFLRHGVQATTNWTLLADRLPADPRHGIVLLSAVYLALIVASLVIDSTQNFLAQWTGQKAMADLRRKLLRHLHRLPVAYYDVTPAGRLVTRLTTDIEALNDLFANGIVALLANIIMTLFFLAAMVRLNWHMSLVLAAVLPVFVVLTTIFRRIVTRSQQRVRVLLARINSFIAEHVNGIHVVHLFNRQQTSLDTFDAINREHMEVSKEWVTANAWFMPSIELLGNVAQAGLLIMGAYLLHGGLLTVGTLVAFLQYGSKFLRPIQEISERYGVLQTSIVSAEKVFALMDTETIKDLGPYNRTRSENADVVFRNVSFAYKPGNWVLNDVSFELKKGQMLAIVGHTGAGKTTISNLLLRFYRPQKGKIFVGGIDVWDMPSSELRRQFGVVLQDTYVREGTILDNICFGSETLTSEDARRAAHQIGLDTLVEDLPDGLETWVQERGDNLSTGQKQMIAFARALAHNPRYLLLDEATSNIDLETEARIRGAMGHLLEGRTSIVIAHRLSTVLSAERILVMHKGRVAETGTHEALLARRGLYWRLFQIQFGYQEEFAELSNREAHEHKPRPGKKTAEQRHSSRELLSSR